MTRRELSRRLTRLEMEANAPTPTKSFWEWLCGRAAIEELDDRGRAMVAELEASPGRDRPDPLEERIAAVGRDARLDAAHMEAPPFFHFKELRDENC